MFRIASQGPEVEFRCSSRNSAQPFEATYSSYNISQRKPGCIGGNDRVHVTVYSRGDVNNIGHAKIYFKQINTKK